MVRSIGFRSAAFVLPLLAAGFLLTSPPQVAHAQNTCDATILKGSYAINFTGTVYDSQYYTYLLSEIGFLNFDGAGNFTGKDTYNFDGAATRRALSGTYVVNSDCSGTIIINASDKTTINGDIAIMVGGKEVEFTQTDAGWIFSGVMKINQ